MDETKVYVNFRTLGGQCQYVGESEVQDIAACGVLDDVIAEAVKLKDEMRKGVSSNDDARSVGNHLD